MQIFETIIRNQRPMEVKVFDQSGFLELVRWNGSIKLESTSALSTFARWQEVVLAVDETIFIGRPGWHEPDRGAHMLEATNIDGDWVEQRYIGGHLVYLMKKIPILIGLAEDDPLVPYKKYEIVKVFDRKPSLIWSGYFEHYWRLKDRLERRDNGAIEFIEIKVVEESFPAHDVYGVSEPSHKRKE